MKHHGASSRSRGGGPAIGALACGLAQADEFMCLET